MRFVRLALNNHSVSHLMTETEWVRYLSLDRKNARFVCSRYVTGETDHSDKKLCHHCGIIAKRMVTGES